MNKLAWIMEIIKRALDPKFCGSIEINVQFGNVSNINVKQSFKPEA